MSHMFEVTEEQYQILEHAAQSKGQTPDALLARWIEELRDPRVQPRYYETDEWFRHLGMSDEEIEEIKREVEAEADDSADA